MSRLLSFLCLNIALWIPIHAQYGVVKLWEETRNRENRVLLTPYIANDNKFDGMAVIVCPGGSYSWLDYDVEGTQVALWLNNIGISAFVLKYRVQGVFEFITHSRAIFGGHKHPDMLEDLQRALQYVRDHAAKYGVNPRLLGAMGFSAGGHLVMSAACFHQTDFISRYGIDSTHSLCPDFVAPIYPVISMTHPDTHRRSRRALLGEWGKRSKKMQDSLSLEKHVPDDCPPVFIVNCMDDPIVKYHNSELLDSALTKKRIPHTYIQFKTGGHGFGASEVLGTAESRQWKIMFQNWVKQLIDNR